MFVDLNLEEDELDVLEYCVDTVLAEWERTYNESYKNPQILDNIAINSIENYIDLF